MIPIKVEREEWSFPELAHRWGMNKDPLFSDLRRLVMQGRLRPYLWAHDTFQQVALLQEGPVAVGEPERFCGPLWAPIECADRTGNLEVVYRALSDAPTQTECTRYWLPVRGGPIALSEVLEDFVVSDENRSAVEPGKEAREVDGAKDKREALSDAALILGLAFDNYGWDPLADKRTGVSDMKEALERVGVPLAWNTINDRLEAAYKLLRARNKIEASGLLVSMRRNVKPLESA